MKKIPKVVLVKWWDAASQTEHSLAKLSRENVEDCLSLCYNVGFLMHENKLGIVLASALEVEAAGDDAEADVFAIPRGCIISMKVLEKERNV